MKNNILFIYTIMVYTVIAHAVASLLGLRSRAWAKRFPRKHNLVITGEDDAILCSNSEQRRRMRLNTARMFPEDWRTSTDWIWPQPSSQQWLERVPVTAMDKLWEAQELPRRIPAVEPELPRRIPAVEPKPNCILPEHLLRKGENRKGTTSPERTCRFKLRDQHVSRVDEYHSRKPMVMRLGAGMGGLPVPSKAPDLAYRQASYELAAFHRERDARVEKTPVAKKRPVARKTPVAKKTPVVRNTINQHPDFDGCWDTGCN